MTTVLDSTSVTVMTGGTVTTEVTGSWVWNWNHDYYGNSYLMFVQNRTNDDDTFYVEDHGAVTNDQIDMTRLTGSDPRYYSNNDNIATLTMPATVYVERVDNNVSVLSPSTGSSPYRLIDARSTYGMTGVFQTRTETPSTIRTTTCLMVSVCSTPLLVQQSVT